MPLIDHFRRMHAFESWASGLAQDSLATIPPARRSDPRADRAARLLPHVQEARRTWLDRVRGEAYDPPADWFPAWSDDATRRAMAAQDQAWERLLSDLTETDLGREITYESSEGKSYASVLADILTHVFNHSTYHRGQVARIVDELGGARAVTDFIAMGRRPR